MNILSIQLGHNSTVSIMKDGKIACALSQEKMDNIKNSSAFPKQAIEWCLKQSKLTPNTVDIVAVCGLNVYPHQLALQAKKTTSKSINMKLKKFLKKRVVHASKATSQKINILYWNKKSKTILKDISKNQQLLNEKLKKEFGIPSKKIMYIKHHDCHAYSSYYSAKVRKDPALIFTLDGSGDFSCATVSIVKDGKIKRIASTPWIHSLGYIYSHTTKFLGMKPLEHEYKVMGLAAYAKQQYFQEVYNKIFKPVIWIDKKNPLKFDSLFPLNFFDEYLLNKAVGVRFDNIAGAVQYLVEDLVTQWIKKAIEKTGIKDIYVGGGVFMNVKLNMKITEMPEVESCYFMPSCGDESNPIGAAYYIYKKLAKKDPKPLKNLYLGPGYTNEEVKTFLDKNALKYKVEYFEDIESKIADMLANFEVIARVKGRSEWGARALGNRSILANPSDMKSFYEVNDMIKKRDFWMPFAPSILDEDADKYIINPKHIEAPFMILAFRTKEGADKSLRAAMHQSDHTVRPQVVTKEFNKEYWALLKRFKEKTGIGGVLNTSLNIHGYPLAATLEQVLFTFENSGLKHIAIENYLVSKHE